MRSPAESTTRSFVALLRETVPDAVVVTSLGRTSAAAALSFPRSLRLDAMGCVSPVAAGIALGVEPGTEVVALDTDGSFVMELSALAVLSSVIEEAPGRLRLVVIDNQILESGGGMPRVPADLDWRALFAAVGLTATIFDGGDLREALEQSQVLVVPVDDRAETEVPRPSPQTGRENTATFRAALAARQGRDLPPPAVKT